jgi:hypothetical protein
VADGGRPGGATGERLQLQARIDLLQVGLRSRDRGRFSGEGIHSGVSAAERAPELRQLSCRGWRGHRLRELRASGLLTAGSGCREVLGSRPRPCLLRAAGRRRADRGGGTSPAETRIVRSRCRRRIVQTRSSLRERKVTRCSAVMIPHRMHGEARVSAERAPTLMSLSIAIGCSWSSPAHSLAFHLS